MGKKLQRLVLTICLFSSIFLGWGAYTCVYAQLSLENLGSLEVRFTQGETVKQEASVTVGLAELEAILSPEFSLSYNQWQPYENLTGSSVNYFVSENNSFAAPGRVQIENISHETFFGSSFENNSGHSIGNLIIAYDFIYNFYERSDASDLVLKYKVNNNDWKNVPGGMIDAASLRSTENVWSSFSIHLNLDDIYLRPSDTIHLVWGFDDENFINANFPMALQRLEVYPGKYEQNVLSRGDLVISEILPSTNVNNSDFEYVEIYNPRETSVSLKGVELQTPSGTKVIQHNVVAEPYSFTVISNVDISSLEGVNNSYFYTGSILTENSSRVDLERDGSLIASATYETSEPGVAVELNRISSAYDGYSSLQDFVPSQSSYFQDLYGSPGNGGITVPMFTKNLASNGYYVVSLPGNPVQRLNRHSGLDFYTLDGEPVTPESLEPYQTVLIHKTDNNPIALYVEADAVQSSQSDISTQITPVSSFISVQGQESIGSNSPQTDYSASRLIPVSQIWNQHLQKFQLQLFDPAQTDPWIPATMNNTAYELLTAAENQLPSPMLDRSVEFSLTFEDGNQSSNDIAMIGFLKNSPQHEQLRYDLPKLSLSHPANNEIQESPLIYLTSSFSEESYNSFTHLPFEIDEEYELGLGLGMASETGGALLRWNITQEIPDEWVITIEDTFTGTVVNVKETDEYRFRYNSQPVNEKEAEESDSPKISTITPQDRPRFTVNIKPYEAFTDVEEEEETPGSIELRPNYPNPFNPTTNINFFLPEERSVRVGIYNIVGQQVALLLDDTIQQGEHSIVWDASDKPSGIYIVQLETGNRIFTRKITLIK